MITPHLASHYYSDHGMPLLIIVVDDGLYITLIHNKGSCHSVASGNYYDYE